MLKPEQRVEVKVNKVLNLLSDLKNTGVQLTES